MNSVNRRGVGSAAAVQEEIMRLEMKLLPRMFDEIVGLAAKYNLPPGRMASVLLAKTLRLTEEEALPPFKPAGRPRKNGNGHAKAKASA